MHLRTVSDNACYGLYSDFLIVNFTQNRACFAFSCPPRERHYFFPSLKMLWFLLLPSPSLALLLTVYLTGYAGPV